MRDIPSIPNTRSKLIFVFEPHLIQQKLTQFLKNLNLEPVVNEIGIEVEAENPRELLKSLKDASLFSSPELEAIELVILDIGESLNFKHLKNLKSLINWLALLDAEIYYEILKNKRLIVYFHPIVDKNLDIKGYECLIRGVGKNGDLLSPYYLFDWAQKTNTLFYLDRTCREICIKTVAAKGLYDSLIYINFVPTSIYDPNFCLQDTTEWAYQLKLNPSKIVFEVVESQRVKDLNHLSNVLSVYREGGFKVALDDVGTGYSNLELLVHLKPDFIKIDREIVRNVDKDFLKQSLVKALCQVCRETNITVVAEGIETASEFAYLKDLVDLMQGFYFAKPSLEPIKNLALKSSIS